MGQNEKETKYKKVNKIIIRCCMDFYQMCQNYRYKVYYSLDIQKNVLNEVGKRLRKKAEQIGGFPNEYCRNHELRAEQNTIEYL